MLQKLPCSCLAAGLEHSAAVTHSAYGVRHPQLIAADVRKCAISTDPIFYCQPYCRL